MSSTIDARAAAMSAALWRYHYDSPTGKFSSRQNGMAWQAHEQSADHIAAANLHGKLSREITNHPQLREAHRKAAEAHYEASKSSTRSMVNASAE